MLSYREAGEKPAEAAEDESLDESNDIKQPPALDGNAVASKEDRDGAVDGNRECEDEEPSPEISSEDCVETGPID